MSKEYKVFKELDKYCKSHNHKANVLIINPNFNFMLVTELDKKYPNFVFVNYKLRVLSYFRLDRVFVTPDILNFTVCYIKKFDKTKLTILDKVPKKAEETTK